jgi:hypothetical protein
MHPKIQFVHGEICPDPFISETNGLRPVFQKLQTEQLALFILHK